MEVKGQINVDRNFLQFYGTTMKVKRETHCPQFTNTYFDGNKSKEGEVGVRRAHN
jgi:hypothetical protein